jgi:hypothetical protein
VLLTGYWAMAQENGASKYENKSNALTRALRLLAQRPMVTRKPVKGTTLYVDTKGSDTKGTGSANSPYATPQKAVNAALPGDTILVRAGFYRGTIDFPRSGTADARISLVGEEGAVLDGSIVIKGWELDPKMGDSGVYRRSVADLPFEPHHMTWNDKYILRLSETQAAVRAPEAYFARLTAPPTDKSWDGLEALFGTREGIAYVRFRNKENPNNEKINFAKNPRLTNSGVVHIEGKSFITVRGFTIQCGGAGVNIRHGATDIIVENNFIRHGNKGVYVNGWHDEKPIPPHRIIVRNNRFTLNYIDDLGPSNKRHGYIWNQFKKFGDYDRQAVLLFCAGDDHEVYGNDIFQHWDGIQDSADPVPAAENDSYGKRLKIYNNRIRDVADDALEPTGGEIDAQWYDNTSINALINLRLKNIKTGPAYFYRNKLSGGGRDIYFFAGSTATMYLYHNTFAAKSGMLMGSTTPEKGAPNTWYLNNIFSNEQVWRDSKRWDMNSHAHYNWIGGEGTRYYWMAEDNIFDPGKRLWADNNADFILNADSPARAKGIDLSKPITLDGKTFGPLPGMNPGYFKGNKPDLGAVQFG